jgi:hypothetical protein
MTDAPEEWIAFKAAARDLDLLVARSAAVLPEDRQHALMIALDRLELSCLALPEVEPDDSVGESPNTYTARYQSLSSAFPELGYYYTVRASPPDKPEEPTVGDAADDLADILRDLDGALWAEQHEGWRNGIWEAKFGYEHHFGAHLVGLRSYLYRLRFFGP